MSLCKSLSNCKNSLTFKQRQIQKTGIQFFSTSTTLRGNCLNVSTKLILQTLTKSSISFLKNRTLICFNKLFPKKLKIGEPKWTLWNLKCNSSGTSIKRWRSVSGKWTIICVKKPTSNRCMNSNSHSLISFCIKRSMMMKNGQPKRQQKNMKPTLKWFLISFRQRKRGFMPILQEWSREILKLNLLSLMTYAKVSKAFSTQKTCTTHCLKKSTGRNSIT